MSDFVWSSARRAYVAGGSGGPAEVAVKTPTLTPGAHASPIAPPYSPGPSRPQSQPGHPGLPSMRQRQSAPSEPSRQSPQVGAAEEWASRWPEPDGDPGVPVSYNFTVEQTQPPDQILGVDVGRNWYSPFQPVAPFGPPNNAFPREWDYPVGENLNFAPPRFAAYERWRVMARTWGVCSTIIQTRMDQLLALPWEIQVRDKPRAKNRRTDELRDFFRRPDGKKQYDPWARMILRDMFEIDAPCLNVGYRDIQGRPLVCEVIDGATIKVLIDDAGRIPDYPSPAYQQIIKGLPMLNFDETDLIYSPMRPHSQLPIYGYSPIEQIEVELTEAIRKAMYQLGFWVEGNLPDLLMSVPKEWTAKQIAAFQAMFDAQLSGNIRQKSKVRFVPEGMKPYDVKNSSGEGLSSNRDEMLVRLCCYAFSVSPSPFIRAMNRATAESAQQEAAQEGLHPLMKWWKDCIMDRIVQYEFGYDDHEFVWLPQAEIDQLKRSQVYMNLVKTALLSPNEARDDMGRQPVKGGDDLLVFTNNGVMTLADAIEVGKAQSMQALGNSQGADMSPTPSRPNDGSAGSTSPDRSQTRDSTLEE